MDVDIIPCTHFMAKTKANESIPGKAKRREAEVVHPRRIKKLTSLDNGSRFMQSVTMGD